MRFEEALSYNDVAMVPRFSNVESRKNVDLTMKLETRDPKTFFKFKLPIISSPMSTVTESEMAFRMAIAGGLGIIHRFNTIEQQIEEVKKTFTLWNNFKCNDVFDACIVGAAIGANGDYLERAKELISAGVEIICIDIAHGNSLIMRKALNEILRIAPKNIHIMASSVAEADGFRNLAAWGADSIRVGISSGANCSTFLATGHGLPTFSSIVDCYDINNDLIRGGRVALIADGGMAYPGDIAKSFGAGATFCMLGSMLAGTKASAGDIIKNPDGKWYKVHRGSASAENQKNMGIKNPKVEGISSFIPYNGIKVENVLSSIEDGLRSACSYSGVEKLRNLSEVAIFKKVTSAGYEIGKPHILNRT